MNKIKICHCLLLFYNWYIGPIEKIQNSITGPLIVYEKNKNKKYHRIFYEYEKTIIQISYSPKDIWNVDVHYQNFKKDFFFLKGNTIAT